MRCLLSTCNKPIPVQRKKTAKYCSDQCYYEAKKLRSTSRYAKIKAPAEELQRNEAILGYLYSIQQLKKQVTASDLKALQFNFSISSGEHLDKSKGICKVIGQYAYYIDPSQYVIVWKSK
jgi:hypothetical protein